MGRRTKKNNSNQPAVAVESADNAVEAATETVTVETENVTVTVETPVEAEITAEPVVADDVLAMLAGDDEPNASEGTTVADPDADAIDAEEPTDEEVLATLKSSGSKKSGSKSTSTPAAPVVMREFTAVAQIDKATLDANLAACNAKKVKEKADNLIAAIQSGKKLSKYTQVAVKELVANGAISGKDMTAAFLNAGLKEGTARAQAQQMTALFKLVGAVAPDPAVKGRLVANDAGLIKELEALAA